VLTSRTLGSRPAMVVFVDHTDCRWLRPLKRGFRHCFVALEHPSGWLVCDSLKSHIELILVELPGPLDLAECYADQGHHVLLGQTAPCFPHPPLPLAPLTCVSVAKRVLAIRADWVWTPWQLFGHLLHARPQSWHHVSAGQTARDDLLGAMIEA
jgi:hypothetical protein